MLSALDITSGALTYDATTASDLTVSSTGPGGTDTFTDTDMITLTASAVSAGWTGNGTKTVTGPYDSVSSMAITTSATTGQKLTLNYAAGDPLPSSGLTYDPSAATGPATNSLTLEGGSFTTETYSATGAGAGAITYSDATVTNAPITFANLSAVDDTVSSLKFVFDAPATSATVNIVNGPVLATTQTDQINDGSTGTFAPIDFGNKSPVTVDVNNAGATTTVNTTTAAAGLTTLDVASGAGGDTINVEATPSVVTSTTDTGSVSGSTTRIGDAGLLTGILGDVYAKSTSGRNTLSIDDSADGTGNTYNITGSQVTASTFPALINFSGGGITTLDLTSPGDGDTFNFAGPVQSAVTTYTLSADGGTGPNTLDVTSSVSQLSYSSAGVLGFGTGAPLVNYTNFQTINAIKPTLAPTGTTTTITASQGQALSDAVVATFSDGDLGNTAADFTASINWGDGSSTSPSPGTIVPTGSGTYSVVGSHTYAKGGTFPVAVTLTSLGSTGTTTVSGTTINVTSKAAVPPSTSTVSSTTNVTPTLLPNSVTSLTGLSISARQNVQTTQDVATFTSNDTGAVPADFTATINWGDGTTATAGMITEDASGVFHVTGTHTYIKAGSFRPTVTIKDINGSTYVTGSLYQANLASSVFGQAPVTDTNLINPWGIATGSTGDIWVADEGSGVATVYDLSDTPIGPVDTIIIPSASGTGTGSPTGIVSNIDTATTDFLVPGTSMPASFLFDTLDGTIAAWASGSSAVTVTNATLAGARYTGLAEASVTTTTTPATTSYYLYAANFNPTSGTAGIVVFDSSFANVTGTTFAGKFVDPNAIAGYNPYNIADLNGDLYVSYAKPTGAAGTFTASDGYIDEYDTSGNFISRVYTDTTGTNLNGPWAMVLAPSGFSSYGGDLLVGNFGDGTGTAPNGTISAINLTTGAIATLADPNGTITNVGQWGLFFGSGSSSTSTTTLYLGAGIDAQAQGLLAQVAPASGASVTVAAAPLTAQGVTIRGIEGNALTQTNYPTTAPTSGGVLVATFMDTGTPGAASSYTATIDWGDGSTPTSGTIISQGTADGTEYYIYGNHTYANVGTYPVTVTITNTANGAIATASSQAVIQPPTLLPVTPQPTDSTPERVIFSGAVGEFTDSDPSATASQFSALISWGDGTPETAGIITRIASTATTTTFEISGTHTYADLYGSTNATSATQTSSTFPLAIHVVGTDGSSVNLTNTATVTGGPFTISGHLSSGSDSGISASDNITNVTQPTFDGTTTEPNALVSLYAQAPGATPVLIGQTTSGANEDWSVTPSLALANGNYLITATAVDAANSTITTTATVVPNLVIDTVGPKVTSVTFSRFQGRIQVTFQDYGGPGNAGVGLAMASLIDASNYQLTTVHHPRVGKYRVNVVSDVPGTLTGTQTVTLSINGGKYIKGGWYFFTIQSANPSDPAGVQDIAGNAMDGEFYGYFPSGNNIPGGNFVAQLTAIHHTIFAPSSVIGRGTPVSPPGTREGNTIVPTTVNPSKFPRTTATGPKAKVKSKAVKRTSVTPVHHRSESLVPRAKHDGDGSVTAARTTSATSSSDRSEQELVVLDAALNGLETPKSHKS